MTPVFANLNGAGRSRARFVRVRIEVWQAEMVPNSVRLVRRDVIDQN